MEIRRLIRGEEGYPSSLGEMFSPERLYAFGNMELLDKPCIGLCGSRSASTQALSWAHSFGTEAARAGVVIVSGYARGVDAEAHRAAMEAGGATIAVLSEGIRHYRVRRELRHVLDLERNFLALSMFEPDDGWTVWRAMERNKLIVGISSGLCVVEAQEKGGTISAAYEAVRQKKPLWAFSYGDNLAGRPGNRRLLAASAALPVSRVEEFRQVLDNALVHPPEEVRQLVMTVTEED